MRNYKTVIDQAKALSQQYAEAKNAAYKNNPDLNPEGQEKATYTALEKAQATFGPQFDGLLSAATAERDAKIAAAAKARPTFDATDTAALVRSQQAWEFLIRPLLDRGLSLSAALATADADGIVGVERFAPTYLALKSPDPAADQRAVVASQVALAYARLAPDKADVILDGASAQPEYAAASWAIGAYRSGDVLGAAMAVAYADPFASQARTSDQGGWEGGESSAA